MSVIESITSRIECSNERTNTEMTQEYVYKVNYSLNKYLITIHIQS